MDCPRKVCRSFLWGGSGAPKVDGEGGCGCACEGDSWSDLNVLGRPSCVPGKAHLAFGCVGLVLSASALCHAAYHLRRQRKFHQQQQSVSTYPAERCRRELHITAIIVSIVHIAYFSMVLGGELLLSIAVLGAVQIPISISAAILVSRMWIYTNNPFFMRKSPEVLRISRWLETPMGHAVAYGLVSISPVGGVVLDLTNHPEEAVKVIAVGIIFLCVGIPGVFWVCGRSLLRAIDESLRLQQNLQEAKATRAEGENDAPKRRSAAEEELFAARKKVKLMVIYTFVTAAFVVGLLTFAVSTKFGTEAPLLLFTAPMALVPSVWNGVNIQIHAGRTKLGSEWLLSGSSLNTGQPFMGRLSGTARRLSITARLSATAKRLSGSVNRHAHNQENQVIPTELPALLQP